MILGEVDTCAPREDKLVIPRDVDARCNLERLILVQVKGFISEFLKYVA